MTVTGYSDRINHALAFAAKHHDQQVRKGTRLPYVTHPANVALILTRYAQDDETVIAGILHDVIEDTVREAYSRDMLQQRVREKFGDGVLATVLQVTLRHVDDDGVELSAADRKEDYLRRLASASIAARWVCAANALHNAASLVADLRRTVDPDAVWGRFKGGKEATVRWYHDVHERLRSLGFDAPIMAELASVVGELEAEARGGQG